MANVSKLAKACAFMVAVDPQTAILVLFVAISFIALARTV